MCRMVIFDICSNQTALMRVTSIGLKKSTNENARYFIKQFWVIISSIKLKIGPKLYSLLCNYWQNLHHDAPGNKNHTPWHAFSCLFLLICVCWMLRLETKSRIHVSTHPFVVCCRELNNGSITASRHTNQTQEPQRTGIYHQAPMEKHPFWKCWKRSIWTSNKWQPYVNETTWHCGWKPPRCAN